MHSARIPTAITLLPLYRFCRRHGSGAPPLTDPPQVSRTVRRSPMAPSARTRTIARSPQIDVGAGTTIAASSGCSSEVESISCASSAFIAMRACVRTCLPASSAASVTGAWRYGHVATTTASTAGSSTTSPQVPYVFAKPSSCAAWRDVSGDRLTTPTSSTPGIAFRPGTCRARAIDPAPIIPMPIRSGSAMSLSLLAHPMMPSRRLPMRSAPTDRRGRADDAATSAGGAHDPVAANASPSCHVTGSRSRRRAASVASSCRRSGWRSESVGDAR